MKTIENDPLLSPALGIVPGIAAENRIRQDTLKSLTAIASKPGSSRNDLLPALRLEYFAARSLIAAKRRLRKADLRQIAHIEDSVHTFGLCGVALITGNREIVDGHNLVTACCNRGIEMIPCLIIDHLSGGDIRRLRIALNRIQERGAWDFDALKLEIQELAVEFGAEFHIPGVEATELDALSLETDIFGQTAADELPPLPSKAVTRLGDVWKLDQHIVGCGDARSLEFVDSLLNGRRARLVNVDMPYNVKVKGHVTSGNHREFVMASGEMSNKEFLRFLFDSLSVIENILIDGGLAFCFMDWRGLKLLLEAAEQAKLDLVNIITWVKANAGQGSFYRSQHEFVVLLKKGTASHVNNVQFGKYGRRRSNVWHHPGASSLGSDARKNLAGHPTPKPVALIEDTLLDASNRADLIVDTFVGSGTCLVAADRTGRIFCGSDLDPIYVDLAVTRWMKLTGKTAVLKQTGENFDAVKSRRTAEAAITNLPIVVDHTDVRGPPIASFAQPPAAIAATDDAEPFIQGGAS